MSANLIALPHSGLRVPHTDLHVSATLTMPGSDAEILNATLRLRNRIVGHLINEGRGGATFFQPTTSGFGWRDLGRFVAACRTPAERIVPEERVLDGLVDEFRAASHIAAATGAGRTPLRRCTTVGGLTFGVATARAVRVSTTAQRDQLRADLARRQRPKAGQWWQMWTGQDWEDLTPRPTT